MTSLLKRIGELMGVEHDISKVQIDDGTDRSGFH